MPYDNEYNRQIAADLGAIDERFAKLYAYSPVDGRGGGYSEGGSNAGVLFQIGNASKRDGEDNVYNDDLALPAVYYYGQDAEALEGGSGFGASTYRDTGFDRVIGAGAASGQFKAGAHDLMHGGNLWTDIGEGFSDLGEDAGKLGKYVFGGKKSDARQLGRQLAAAAKMHGGSWWDSIKEGVSDVVGLVPELIAAAGKPKRVRKAKLAGGDAAAAEVAAPASAAAAALAGGAIERIVGGAILGNPDPHLVRGDSARIAGRGKKAAAGPVLTGPNGDLLAASPAVLANGVPPVAQLRGSYGGKKPAAAAAPTKAQIIAAVKAKLAGGAACVDSPALAHLDIEAAPKPKRGGKNLAGATAPVAPAEAVAGAGASAKRAKRVAIVKKVMAERGCGMIEASKYVKEKGLYKP